MKTNRNIPLLAITTGCALTFAALVPILRGADQAASPKAYPLQTCLVTGEKLDGTMGKAYVFTHQGQEIKLCCKSCLNDFNQTPAKYLKKLEPAQKAAKAPAAPCCPPQDHCGY